MVLQMKIMGWRAKPVNSNLDLRGTVFISGISKGKQHTLKEPNGLPVKVGLPAYCCPNAYYTPLTTSESCCTNDLTLVQWSPLLFCVLTGGLPPLEHCGLLFPVHLTESDKHNAFVQDQQVFSVLGENVISEQCSRHMDYLAAIYYIFCSWI